MPNYFTVPPIFRTFYRNLESNFYTGINSRWSIKHFLADEKTQLWLGFYFALFSSIIGTYVFLNQTGLARTIMDASRAQTSERYHQLKAAGDRSFLRFTASNGLVVLVLSPDGKYTGDTSEGIHFNQIPNALLTNKLSTNLGEIITNKSRTLWGLLISSPTNGTYNLEFSAKYPGTYRFTIYVGDYSGQENTHHIETVVIQSNEHRRYVLDYNREAPDHTHLTFKNNFYRP